MKLGTKLLLMVICIVLIMTGATIYVINVTITESHHGTPDLLTLTRHSETELSRLVQNLQANEVREITLGGERYLTVMQPWTESKPGYLLLKSDDDANSSLPVLQRRLLILGLVVMFIAIIVTRWLTRSLSRLGVETKAEIVGKIVGKLDTIVPATTKDEVASVLRHRLVLPLSGLAAGIKAVEAGDLDTVVPVTAQDEIDDLTHQSFNQTVADIRVELTQSFNQMVASIREKQKMADIVAQKDIEQCRSISEMVAGVAHEINTPLGIVNSAANIIEDSLKPETISALSHGKDEDTLEMLQDVVDASQLIQTHIQRAATLIQQFKQVSVDQLTDTLETMDLVAKLDELIKLYKVGHRQSALDIELHHELADTDRQWRGYPGYLFQIVQNLFSNIARYAYPDNSGGKVKVTVQSTTVEEKAGFVISIQDFGAGMSKEGTSRVFEVFYTTGRSKGGSGLGMAIVRNIVNEALQGNITVSSTLGKGTTFQLRFPQVLSTEP